MIRYISDAKERVLFNNNDVISVVSDDKIN